MKLRQCLDHIDELGKHISEVEQEILRLSDKYEAALNLIRTVPGFDKNPMTAIQVLSEIGGDMSVFPTAKHLVSWAGCCPRNDKSDRKIKSRKHPEFTTRYKRIKARRGHKKTIIAICRMILTAIWHILTDLKPYTPDGFLESRPVNKEKVLTTSQTLNLLKQRGYHLPLIYIFICFYTIRIIHHNISFSSIRLSTYPYITIHLQNSFV